MGIGDKCLTILIEHINLKHGEPWVAKPEWIKINILLYLFGCNLRWISLEFFTFYVWVICNEMLKLLTMSIADELRSFIFILFDKCRYLGLHAKRLYIDKIIKFTITCFDAWNYVFYCCRISELMGSWSTVQTKKTITPN